MIIFLTQQVCKVKETGLASVHYVRKPGYNQPGTDDQRN